MRCRTSASVLTLVLVVAGCSSSASTTPPGGHGATSATNAPPAHATVVTDTQNGHVVAARVGDVLQVQLGSTYWRFAPISGHVLHTQGAPSFDPGPSCVPGGGCGTITQSFRALRKGTAHITASRTTCGEALRCAPNESRFSVTVVVG